MLYWYKITNTDAAPRITEPSVYYEVNCYNIDVKTTWKFRSYTPYARDDKAMVKGGDVIQVLNLLLNLLDLLVQACKYVRRDDKAMVQGGYVIPVLSLLALLVQTYKY